MANPQKENGHVDLANEIVEAMAKTYFSSYEIQVLFAIFRKTYGWHKKEDWITGSQLVNMTGINKSHISRTLKRLIKRNLITKNGKKISFQKDYEKWRKLPNQVTSEKLPNQDKKLPKQVTEVTQIGNKKLPKQVNTKETKETSTKEIYTKEKKISFNFKTGLFNNLTIEQMEEYEKKYPDIDIYEEEKKMTDWLIGEKVKKDNGQSNKIPKDFSRFINNWLRRSK